MIVLRDGLRRFSAAAGSIAVALSLVVVLLSAVISPASSWTMRTAVIGFGILAISRPDAAALVTAAFVAFNNILANLVGAPPLRVTEILVVGTLLGCAVRALLDTSLRRAVAARISMPIAVFATAIVASAVVWQRVSRFETGDPIYLEALLQFVTRDYFTQPGDFWVLVSTAVMLEGLALYLIVAALCQKDPTFFDRALRMLVLGGAGLAVMSVVRLAEILLRNPAAIAAMRATSAGLRVSPQIGDSIAAGSYFALCWVAALGVAIAAPRGRLLWLGLSVPLVAALYLTGSRSVIAAMVAGLLVLGILVVIREHGRMVRGIIAFAIIAIVAMVVSYPWLIGRDIAGQKAARSLTIRRELALSGLRVMATRPVFGVGIDRFYLVAGSVASPELNAMWRGRKNPHNDFLRIGAELGLIGLALFLWILTGAARRTWLLLQQTLDPRLAGLAGGLVAFLVTSLVSNPLMVRDVSYAFWIALGLAVGQSPPSPAAGETQLDTAPPAASWRDRFVRWRWALGIVLCGVLVFSVPFRSRQEIAALDVARVSYGLFDWTTDANGVRCRLSGPRATIFVDGDVRQVDIPLSGTLPSGLPQQVEVQLDGRLANRVSVGPDWQWLRITLPRGAANPRRIDLTVTPSWVPADVIHGNRDRREFGVRVGEISVRALDRR